MNLYSSCPRAGPGRRAQPWAGPGREPPIYYIVLYHIRVYHIISY